MDTDRLDAALTAALEEVEPDRSGETSDYLDDVAGQQRDGLAAAVCTVDGHQASAGEAEHAFALQSVSKALTYAVVLEEVGLDAVLEHVGVEPSGEAFNHLSLHDDGRPYNPLINAGAIMAHALVPGKDAQTRAGLLLDRYSAMAGARLEVSDDVRAAESARADRNLGLAHLLADPGVLPIEAREAVDGYLTQCSILVTAPQLAVMGATLAAGGVNPLTGERVLQEWVAEQSLSVMLTCGMYDATGQWVAEVGVPAKSGVSGALLGAVPGAVGIATWSPRLDERGNSMRGIGIFERLSERWDLHVLRHRGALAGLRGAD
ncbi:glutaminase A [Micrococcaceae bacterium Sec6.3]